MSLSHMVYEVCFIVMVTGHCGHGVYEGNSIIIRNAAVLVFLLEVLDVFLSWIMYGFIVIISAHV